MVGGREDELDWPSARYSYASFLFAIFLLIYISHAPCKLLSVDHLHNFAQCVQFGQHVPHHQRLGQPLLSALDSSPPRNAALATASASAMPIPPKRTEGEGLTAPTMAPPMDVHEVDDRDQPTLPLVPTRRSQASALGTSTKNSSPSDKETTKPADFTRSKPPGTSPRCQANAGLPAFTRPYLSSWAVTCTPKGGKGGDKSAKSESDN